MNWSRDCGRRPATARSHQGPSRRQDLVDSLRAKVDAQPLPDPLDQQEAIKFVTACSSLLGLLEKPDIQPAIIQLRKVQDTTVGHLLGFMNAFNLRFGPAKTLKEKQAYHRSSRSSTRRATRSSPRPSSTARPRAPGAAPRGPGRRRLPPEPARLGASRPGTGTPCRPLAKPGNPRQHRRPPRPTAIRLPRRVRGRLISPDDIGVQSRGRAIDQDVLRRLRPDARALPRRQGAGLRRGDDGGTGPSRLRRRAPARSTRCSTSSKRPATSPRTPRSWRASSASTTAPRPRGPGRLEEAKAKLRELVKEVLHDDPPTPSIRSNRRHRGRGE